MWRSCSANPDTARGFSANVFLDEFAFHKDSREIWKALFCFRDNESKLVGFDVDLLQEIGKRLSRVIVFKVIEWDKKIEALNSKTIDLIASNLSITEERKKVIAYTEPLIQNAQAIIVNATSPIHTKNDIIGKKICLLQDSNAIPIVERFNVKSGSKIGRAHV